MSRKNHPLYCIQVESIKNKKVEIYKYLDIEINTIANNYTKSQIKINTTKKCFLPLKRLLNLNYYH